MVCGIVTSVREVVAAGRSFFETFEKNKPEENSSEESSQEGGDPESPRAGKSRKNFHSKPKKELLSGNALRLSGLVKDVNLYGLLEVTESSSSEEIKKSYRKLVLEKHPDKHDQGLCPKEAEAKRTEFLQIQEAFEVLSEPRTRRMYDSSLPFDDTLPSEKEIRSETDFFTVFDSAFCRNERWSIHRPAPKLGSADSTREEVDKFYDFWFNKFESWRDFSNHDEHDLKQAESRDEKRWMEVQNARIRKKRLAEENSRIRKLVDLSEKMDPRLRRWRAAEIEAVAEEKRRRKYEREEQARALQDKQLEKERMEMEKKREAEIEKEKIKLEKAEIKKIRGEIRQVLALNDPGQDQVLVAKFNEKLLSVLSDLEGAKSMLERAKAVACMQQDQKDLFVLQVVNQSREQFQQAPRVVAQIEEEKPAIITGWTGEELQLLTRGMQKYPVGTNRRWEVIQSLIGSSKSVSEIIDMSKIVASKKVIEPAPLVISKKKAEPIAPPDIDYEREAAKNQTTTTSNEEDWNPAQQKQLEDAMRKFPATLPAPERWSSIATEVEGKTKQQCVARFKYIRELIAKKK